VREAGKGLAVLVSSFMGIHRWVWVRLSRGADLGVDSSSRVIASTWKLASMLLNPEALRTELQAHSESR
jgi:hypothetical protein